ncbi:MAG: hypothetical protein KatS3mg110_3293 [Pirellulaceae bacterium]|nr:MAG: hypothetical protein KatS3mg110_3293 [Pirellulaceae bacterium]
MLDLLGSQRLGKVARLCPPCNTWRQDEHGTSGERSRRVVGKPLCCVYMVQPDSSDTS